MPISKKSLISPVPDFIWAKSRQSFYTISLFAIVLGIFLLPKTALMAGISPEKIIELTNQQRTQFGINELSISDQLTHAAAAKAEAILASQIFDHTINDRRFSSWVKDSGYKYTITGENLAIDFISSEGVVKAWMASPDHRQNILAGQYRDIGVAAAEGIFAEQKTIIVVQIFGAPRAPQLIPPDIARRQEHWKPLESISFFNQSKILLSYNTLEKNYLFSSA